VLGIALGIVLGVGVVAAFVFLGSEETIDAPRLSDGSAPDPAPPPSAGLPIVRVVGDAPPSSGPVEIEVERGARARFRVVSDGPTVIEVPGYGIRRGVDGSLVVGFRASRAGRFRVIVSGPDVAVATLRVTSPGGPPADAP
jgi:hypothetical protein